MTPCVLSPVAVADLKKIWKHVAAGANVPTADRIGGSSGSPPRLPSTRV